MATFLVCTRCGKTIEIVGIDQFPASWERSDTALLCPRCVDAGADEGDILDEQVIYPDEGTAFDESFGEDCEVCRGPCRGH